MGKLSHIDDIEDATRRAASHKTAPQTAPREQPSVQRTAEQRNEEAAFHGLDEKEPMGLGQKIIIGCAFAALVLVIAYVLNYWLHFV